MIGGKLYDFDYSGVTKDRWGQTLNPFLKGLDVVLAQNLQRDQQEAYQQGLSELSKNQYGLQPMNEEGLAAMIASNPNLDQEDIEVIKAMQGPQSGQGLAGMSAPQRRQFAITPEMQQRAVAIDYLTGSQPGTALNQLMGQYKDLVASADEKAIEDYRAERAYQDARADKAKAEAWKEREYADLKKKEERGIMLSDEERARKQREEERDIAKEQRDIEKEKRKENIESLEKYAQLIQVDKEGKITNPKAAQKRLADKIRKLEPELFEGLTDDDVLKTAKDYKKQTSGMSLDDRMALKTQDFENKIKLKNLDYQNKLSLLNLQDKIKEKIPLSKEAEPFLQAASRFLDQISNDSTGLGKIEGGMVGSLMSLFNENVLDDDTISQNRSNLAAVKTQMNIFLRKKLQDAGVKSGEINSAIEQARYSYPLEENMSVAQIRLTIDNFIKDMIDGSGIQKLTNNNVNIENKKQSAPVKKVEPKKEQSSQTYTKTNKGMAF